MLRGPPPSGLDEAGGREALPSRGPGRVASTVGSWGLLLNTQHPSLPAQETGWQGQMEGHMVTATPLPPGFSPLVRSSELDPHSPC